MVKKKLKSKRINVTVNMYFDELLQKFKKENAINSDATACYMLMYQRLAQKYDVSKIIQSNKIEKSRF